MNTQNTIIFPNYIPEGTVKENTVRDKIIDKTGHDAFLILHDYESDNKITDFLSKIKSKYQHIVEDSEIFKNMDQYNLVDIFNEVHNNLYYVGNNLGQLELIEKFNISSFDMLYAIMDTIGMSHGLHWKHISMPVNKFSLLTQYIEHYNTKYFTQEDYLLMAQDLEYHNMEGLYSGLSALNLADGITKIEFNYIDTVNILMFTHKYISRNIEIDEELTNADLKIIYENYFDGSTHSKKHSFSSVKRLLALFGYQIQDSQIKLKAA